MKSQALGALGFGWLALTGGAAHAQCTTSPANDVTVVICPGRVDTLRTDPNGNVSGMIGGRPFSGVETSAGSITGRLGSQPYEIQGGRSPDPLAPNAASTWPPPLATGLPPPGIAQPSVQPYTATDAATREALLRRYEYLRKEREKAARAQAEKPTPEAKR